MDFDLKGIIRKMPADLTKLEQARYIYLELGKMISYDAQYLIAKTLEEKQSLFDEEVDLDSWTKNTGICSTISKIYAQLLQEVGIEAEVVHQRTGEYLGHVFNIFTIDGKSYYADLTRDISNTKKGFETEFFGTMPFDDFGYIDADTHKEYTLTSIHVDEIQEMDDKLKYTFQGIYMNDVISMLRKELKGFDLKPPTLRDDEDISEYNERVAKYEARMKELCEIFGAQDVEDLRKNLIDYKVRFVREAFGDVENLTSLERIDYLSEVLRNVMLKEDLLLWDANNLKCIDKDGNLQIFTYFVNKATHQKFVYVTSDTEFAREISEPELQAKVEDGLTTLSEKPIMVNELNRLSGIQKPPTATVDSIERLAQIIPPGYVIGFHGFDDDSLFYRNANREYVPNPQKIADRQETILKEGLKFHKQRTLLSTVTFDPNSISSYISTSGYYSTGGIIVGLPIILESESGRKIFLGGPDETRLVDRNHDITSFSEAVLPEEGLLDPRFIVGTYTKSQTEDGTSQIEVTFNPEHIAFTGGTVSNEYFAKKMEKLLDMERSGAIPASAVRNTKFQERNYILNTFRLQDPNIPPLKPIVPKRKKPSPPDQPNGNSER